MEAMESDAQENRKRSWIATAVTLIVLTFLIVFAARVYSYVQKIQNGEIDLSTYNFVNRFTGDLALSSAPIGTGTFDVLSTDDPTLGNPDARLTIVEFADFQCPYSQEASRTMRELASKYPDDLFYVYRDLPLTDIHPLSVMAALAGQCAHEQDKFWEYHDKVYQNQLSLTEESFLAFARELNLNSQQFSTCLTSERYKDEVAEDLEAGIEAGVRGTPTFFVNGNRIPGAIPGEVMEAIVQSVIQRE
jgi:protein-disulfide isomerase